MSHRPRGRSRLVLVAALVAVAGGCGTGDAAMDGDAVDDGERTATDGPVEDGVPDEVPGGGLRLEDQVTVEVSYEDATRLYVVTVVNAGDEVLLVADPGGSTLPTVTADADVADADRWWWTEGDPASLSPSDDDEVDADGPPPGHPAVVVSPGDIHRFAPFADPGGDHSQVVICLEVQTLPSGGSVPPTGEDDQLTPWSPDRAVRVACSGAMARGA